jgi:hypothetical protein
LWSTSLPGGNAYRWGSLAEPAQPCGGNTCFTLLATAAANSTGAFPVGDYVALLDGNDGAELWRGPGNNCLGCSQPRTALGDVTSDGTPDFFITRTNGTVVETLALIDGASRTEIWHRDLPSWVDVHRLFVSSGQPRRLAVQSSAGFELVDVATGDAIRSLAQPAFIADATYVPLDASQGLWALVGEDTLVVADQDLLRVESIPIERVSSVAAGSDGAVYAGSSIAIHRIEADNLFRDGFED